MSIAYNTSVNRDGLVLYLDAANTKSYPGSGTTYFDLSGIGNDSTLVNGVTYSSSNKGILVFDGVNDAITIPNNVVYTNGFSISLWVYPTLVDTLTRRIIDKTTTTTSPNGLFMHITSTQLFFNINATSIGITVPITSVPINKWTHIAFSTTNTGLTAFYIDGKLFTTQTLNPPSGITVTSLLTIGNRSTALDRPFNGSINSFMFYHSILPASGVKQNFEATRSRYGI